MTAVSTDSTSTDSASTDSASTDSASTDSASTDSASTDAGSTASNGGRTTVTATTGRPTGSRPSRRLRNDGQLPGVVYGKGIEPTAVHVDYAELRDTLKGDAGLNTVFTMDIDGAQHTVIVRDIQRDPLRRTVSHADFLRVDDAKQVKLTVPVVVTGRATKVLEAGGIIEQKMHSLKILVDPTKVPNRIEADVSSLSLDSRLSLGDLTLPEGVSTLVSDGITIAAPVVPRGLKSLAEEEEEEAAAAEDEEGVAQDEGDTSDDDDGDSEE